MKRYKILSFLIMFGLLMLGGITTIEAQKLSNKTFKTWRISEGESGGIDGTIHSYSITSDGNFIVRKNVKTSTKKIDEMDLQEIAVLLEELKLPGTKTKIVKGSRIYDGIYGGFTITLDGKDYKISGNYFSDQKQVVLKEGQKKTLEKLKEKLTKVRASLSKMQLSAQKDSLAIRDGISIGITEMSFHRRTAVSNQE